MKIDFTAQLRDADDNVVMEKDAPASVLTLLKRAVLADVNPDGSPVTPDEKFERFELWGKLKTADSETDFTLPELTLLDKVVRVYPTLIMGQLLLLVNNKTKGNT